MKIIRLDKVDSTNEYCKRLEGIADAVVVAAEQTQGKGTRGRSFVSDKGGLYVSVMRTLEGYDGADVFKILINSCVAVCRTVEYFGLKPVIRWANDVLVDGKKICGTLIENTLVSGGCRTIIGMGVNVNNDLPEELDGIATSFKRQLSKKISVDKVCRVLLKNLEKEYTIDDYKSYINWFSQTVTLNQNGSLQTAIALDVNENGLLICSVDGEIKKISSAEVSLRI